MSLFLIFWIRCHFLLYTKTKGDKDVMIKKITVKGEFSNRTYLYEVEDGIDFFDAVRKASAEFVNTPDGRKIYYKKGSFSWLDFSLLFVAAGAGDQFGGLQLAMILSRETTLGLIVWMPGQKMKQRKS